MAIHVDKRIAYETVLVLAQDVERGRLRFVDARGCAEYDLRIDRSLFKVEEKNVFDYWHC